ncbi:N-acetyltransferase [Corynebacterium yudongzhengii]|uniref:N-acetyltransferase n=1 Tax=Corynebacterium yudongzhengii TaxID=2080740 RepID=A0A2U1T5W2_9CORY|nr:GNAT family N-acetyltransferase [Corynebacterium yudongzhengii]AWB81033.1 N-acetyltransferase [Corynebacterium yudongzhengii]PWC01278.1 N-acetyltransferase [Corynebacterium yudongzhengii]
MSDNARDKQGSEVVVEQNPATGRFEISYVDGHELAGSAQYLDHGQERIFFHTEVDEKFGGRGLAGILIGRALEETTAQGLRIVAVCPFVKGFIDQVGYEGDYRGPQQADLQYLEHHLGA